MRKLFIIAILPFTLFFAISSCSKNGANGATGPAGPLSTGTLTGYVTTYDQYGFKLLGGLSGVTVHISDSTADSAVTNSAGAYAFSNLKTGIYTITYSKAGFGSAVANDYAFLGGGTLVRNQSISLFPSFSLFNANSVDTTIATDPGVLIRGIDSADQVARTFIIFGGTNSSVSSAPGNYVYVNTGTIKASAGAWGLFITSQELHDNGLASGTTAYFVVYPISTGSPTYLDLSTGKTVYTAVGATPSNVLTVTVP